MYCLTSPERFNYPSQIAVKVSKDGFERDTIVLGKQANNLEKIRQMTLTILDSQQVLTTLQQHHETIKKLGVHSLALFGSTARNNATQESDLDFLVEFEGSATFDRYMDLKIFLEDLFDKPIDLVTKQSLKSQIKQAILQEAINVT